MAHPYAIPHPTENDLGPNTCRVCGDSVRSWSFDWLQTYGHVCQDCADFHKAAPLLQRAGRHLGGGGLPVTFQDDPSPSQETAYRRWEDRRDSV